MKKIGFLFLTILVLAGSANTKAVHAAEMQSVENMDIEGDIGDALSEDALQEEFAVSDKAAAEASAADVVGARILSVQKVGKASLEIKWEEKSDAVGYELYRSTKENGAYEKIYTAEASTITSYTDNVKKGILYSYKLVTITAEGSIPSSAYFSRMIPKSSKKIAKTINEAAFSMMEHYYYEDGGKLNVVLNTADGNLKIMTFNSKMKLKKKKTVKLEQYDVWGGFYHGPDGKNYVAVGYNNKEENDAKTVIKVIQYSAKWKKQKTASIAGSAKNSFKGIYIPFAFGRCRMDMQEDQLYMHTCRQMYVLPDGLHHQSNISFVIDTKTMKAQTSNDSYVSHSFNQYVKFKDGNLYLLDQGDAYPRAIQLSVTEQYSRPYNPAAPGKRSKYSVFKLEGEIGNNSTGSSVGGLEVGSETVLTVGAAQPHGYAIKGVTGFSNYKYNVYLTVTNRQTGKTNVKWLTKNNPITTKTTVSMPKIVKLSEDRFAILFTSLTGEKSTLNYIVVDGNGKKVYSKKYKNTNLAVYGVYGIPNQPCLIQGKLVWTVGMGNWMEIYSIPAMYK